ncbi:MAG: undecaprenyl-diphosphate phosphatase [Clostridiales bacterium]|nr:undecaprenyl-diphosphate phosphatase [Clostridiales bacterium]
MNMVWWQAMVLGLVQGLTEFLPVSSSGHLILVRELMGLNNGNGQFNLMFDVFVHLGTLVAVVIVLYKPILELFKKPFKRLLMLIVATIPAVIVGFAFKDYIEQYFSTATYLCFFFLFTAIIMFVSEVVAKRNKSPKPLSWGGAVAMGFMQGAGVFPGISRSGSTIFGGTVTGTDSKEVATFSFLMSIPVICGSLLLSVIDVAQAGALAQIDWFSIFVGAMSAFASGYIAIRVMLKLIAKANYKWFSLYLLIIAILTFSFYFIPSL